MKTRGGSDKGSSWVMLTPWLGDLQQPPTTLRNPERKLWKETERASEGQKYTLVGGAGAQGEARGWKDGEA